MASPQRPWLPIGTPRGPLTQLRGERLTAIIHEDRLTSSLPVEITRDRDVFSSDTLNFNTRSGFDWGGGPGPDLRLTPGTGTEVSVLVEYRQPISYVIPLLRDITGIY